MRKLLIGTAITAMMIVGTLTGATAQHRGHGHGGHAHHGHRHNVAPWIVGGAVLGIIGAGIYANQYRSRTCWDERQPVVDYSYNRIVGYRYVRVCD